MDGPHGDSHMTRRVLGVPREHKALCGRDTRTMRKVGWFRGWPATLCGDCARAADLLDD